MNKILPNKILPNKTLKNPLRLRGYNSVSGRNAGRNLTKGLSKIFSVLIVGFIITSFIIVIQSDNKENVEKVYSSHVPIYRNITEPQDDVYIREEYPDINYNSNNWLMILETTGSKDYRTFLKFNFSELPEGNWDIVNVTIGLFCWQVDADCDGAMTGIASCNDNTWTEESLTWNNQPSYGDEISVGGGGSGINEWKLWSNTTLTNYVNNSYQAGNNSISFVMLEDRLKYPAVLNDDRYWDSKEYIDAPFLLVWFKESYISFTSNPVTSANINEQYFYNVTGRFWGANLNMTSTAIWLIQEFGSYNLTGVPQITHVGIYLVNLTLYYNGTTVYQNYTIGVFADESISDLNLILIYIVFFVLLLIMSFIGSKWNIPVINLISLMLGFFTLVAVLSLFEELIIIPLTIVIIMSFLLIKVLKY